jgi:FSR family fosmidomycin resistance protein-like MFS transporter
MTATDSLGLSRATKTERRALAVAVSAHVIHDGYTDLLYVLLPIWQAEFGLGYAEVGMLRGSYMATMSTLQIPASHVAERVSPIVVLAGGTLLAATCFLLAGASTGLVGLLAALLLGGIGASVQHPIASSIVSSAFDGAGRARRLQLHRRCRQDGAAGAHGATFDRDDVAPGAVDSRGDRHCGGGDLAGPCAACHAGGAKA